MENFCFWTILVKFYVSGWLKILMKVVGQSLKRETSKLRFSSNHRDIEDPDKSFHLTTEESPSFHTGEMVYSSLSIINQNESYSVAHGSCLNETCVQLQAEVNALQAENEHLKAQLQGTCNSELAVQHLRAALYALTSSRNLTYTATSQICSGSFSVQKTDMQQLVKDSNGPDLFRNVLVPKRELHKLLEEAKAARDSACFLLNGVSEILFSPKELAAAKGVTKARAGTAALDEEKVDALFEFMKSVRRANGWPAMDNRTLRRKLAIKICNARRGLKKTPTLEMNNELAGFN
ncbi:uncharacterized protein [Pleurodeles waltl]|uniref:uncharacterized protein n=1 Tax=Pleurodeles waltl TaxID=8319 RepID=UPI003709C52A